MILMFFGGHYGPPVIIGWKVGKNITETKKFKTENSFWQNIIILSQGFVMEDNEEFL